MHSLTIANLRSCDAILKLAHNLAIDNFKIVLKGQVHYWWALVIGQGHMYIITKITVMDNTLSCLDELSNPSTTSNKRNGSSVRPEDCFLSSDL